MKYVFSIGIYRIVYHYPDTEKGPLYNARTMGGKIAVSGQIRMFAISGVQIRNKRITLT